MNVLLKALDIIGNALPPPGYVTTNTAASIVHHLFMMRAAAEANDRAAFWANANDMLSDVANDLVMRDREQEAAAQELAAFHEAQNATKH